MLIDTGKRRIVVNQLFYAVGAVDADSGTRLWWIPTAERSRTQPISNEGYLFLLGSVMLRLKPDGGYEELWRDKIRFTEYNAVYNHTIIHDGRLYVLKGDLPGKRQPIALVTLDARTGAILDTKTVGTGATIVMAQGMLYLVDNRPRVTLLQPTATGLEEVSSFAHGLGTTHQLYTHAVIADGRLFLRHLSDAFIYDLRGECDSDGSGTAGEVAVPQEVQRSR